MKSRLTFQRVLLATLIIIFVAALPSSLRYAYQHGGFYLFSEAFLRDLPKRLTGPGRLRFILQPTVSIFLGIRAGIADARAGRPPYIFGIITGGSQRVALLRDGFAQLSTLILMAILLDAISQFLILHAIYPGAALVVGPILIAFPYSLSRALANRWSRRKVPALEP